MPSPEPSGLTEALGSYPADHPQTLSELVAADPGTITDSLAWFLRKQVVAATRAADRHHVRGPADALKLLSNGYALHTWEGAWVAYALSGDRQVVLVSDDKGSMKSLRKATRLLPKRDDLPAIPASASRGTKRAAWLILYGGDPSVLSKEHVARGLATLQRVVPVADVCFYDCDPARGVAPTLWSVRAGVGVVDGSDTPVAFPNPDVLEEVRNYERS